MPWEMTDAMMAALCGLGGGVVLGLAARIGRFCSLGAIEDALYGGDWSRLLMWPLALAAAILLSAAAAAAGLVDLDDSLYLSTAWNPVASVLGGLAFGYGMALAGNCGFGALARLGGGDMRSFVIVLVTGISGYVTLNGPLAGLRLLLFPTEPLAPGAIPPGIPHRVEAATGLPPAATTLIVVAALAALALAPRALRASRSMTLWAVAVGVAIASGWAGTGLVSAQAFDPISVQSHTFVRPLGTSILYLMTSSGGGLGFAVGSVSGVLIGAVLGSLWLGSFQWEACDDPAELRRQAYGGALMGVGGVVALGCTVGQGLSAFSVLAISAPVTAAAIFAGAAIGLRQLIVGFQTG